MTPSDPTSAEGPTPPSAVRQLRSPAALALADLAAVFEDLQTVLRCCERLVVELSSPAPDDLAVEAYWTTALLSYARCFTPGPRGVGLTEEDLTSTGLEGEVLAWHRVLLQLRERYADVAVNPVFTREPVRVPRNRIPVGGKFDERLVAQQQVVFTAVAAMARPALDQLPVLHLTT